MKNKWQNSKGMLRELIATNLSNLGYEEHSPVFNKSKAKSISLFRDFILNNRKKSKATKFDK
jgi:hypothetical protein